MNTEEHKAHHVMLHEKLDELFADFVSHNEKGPSETSVMELMAWSHAQTLSPTEKPDPNEIEEKPKSIMTPVESSNIQAVGYVQEEEKLIVEFKNGQTYEYYRVSIAVYEEFMAAPSIGKYFHLYIRSAFAYMKQ